MRERPPGSGQWQLRVYAGAVDGKKTWVSKTFRGTERQAVKALSRFETEHADQKVPLPGQGTVTDLLEAWYAGKHWQAIGSKRQARGDLDRYLIPQLGHLPTNRLGHEHIDRLYQGLLAGTLARRGRPLGPGTVRRLHATLHSALEWAVKKGRLGQNPADRVSAPTDPLSEVRAPDVTEVLLLVARAAPPFAAFLSLAAATGRRRQDLLGLQARDILFDEQAIVFQRRAVLGDQGVTIEVLDKNRRGARIAVAPQILDRLRDHIDSVAETARLLGTGYGPTSFVFSDDGSQPWRPDSTSRKFRLLAEQCGLGDLNLHGLRHFHITELLVAGVDVETVAKRAGDNAQTIYKTYSHFRPKSDEAAALIAGDLLRLC